MKRTLISQLGQHIGHHVTLKGWIHTLRDQKRMQFLILRDHTGPVQVVLRKAQHPGLAETVSGLTRESAICITGQVAENPHVKLGGIEIHLTGLHIENRAVSPLPLDPFSETRPNLDSRLDWRHLDLRRPENRLLFRVQTTAEMAMREYWCSEGFIEIHSPKLMGSASESGAELFALKYFGTTAYLAQSPQFYKQMAMAAGFDQVFEIAPVFRANPSFTSRHDTEFTSVDVEISWIESHEDLMAFEERWLRHVLKAVKNAHGEELSNTFGVNVKIPEIPFPMITLAKAVEILAGQGHTPEKPGDLDPRGERLLGNHILKTFNHEFVFLTDYPASIRPFYHMRHASGLTKSFDLLWKGLEVTTGAQREHRHEALVSQALEKGLRLEPIRFYLDFFKYGCPPHGGFGFGLTRMLMVMLGIRNVREVTIRLPGTQKALSLIQRSKALDGRTLFTYVLDAGSYSFPPGPTVSTA